MNFQKLVLRPALLMLCLIQHSLAQVKTLKGGYLSTSELDSFVRYQMDSLKIPAISIAIIQNGRVVYYKANGIRNEKGDTIDSNTLFEAASMTKPVFAYAVHKLVQRRKFNLDTPLYKYYPYDDIAYDDRYKMITARMVLSHTTGFPNWRGCGGSDLVIMAQPGTTFGYSGEGFEFLSHAVCRRLDKKITDIIDDEVLRPLSMNCSFLVENQYVHDHIADGWRDDVEWGRNGRHLRPHVAFGLCTEAKEYAKFVIRLMQERQTKHSIFDQMSVAQVQADSGTWACLGLFMEQTPYGPRYGHSGNNNNRYNSNFEFYRDRDTGFVFFMNCHKEPQFTRRLNEFLETGIHRL